MDLQESLSNLELQINTKPQNQAVEQRNVSGEEFIKQEENTQDNENNKATEQDNAMTVADMSYGEVTEMAKKSNLVATAQDENFVSELSDKNKEVLKASIDLEREKVETEKQRIKLEQEKFETEKEKNLNERLKGKFGSRLDAQEFYYKSLKSILETVGIRTPMNVGLMWIIAVAICIIPIYPIRLLFCATFGNLIAGATSESRKGFAKGCMWTAVSVLGVAIIVLIVFALYKIGIYIF